MFCPFSYMMYREKESRLDCRPDCALWNSKLQMCALLVLNMPIEEKLKSEVLEEPHA